MEAIGKIIKYFFIRVSHWPFTNSFNKDVLKKILPLNLGDIVESGFGAKYTYIGNKRFILNRD